MHHTSISNDLLLQQLRWRYATKKFDATRKIPDTDWKALEHALILTPSSFGLQPWKFIVIKDPDVREALVPFSWGQRQVAEASHFVVFAIKTNLTKDDVDAYIARIAEVRSVSVESLAPFRELMMGKIIEGPLRAQLDEWTKRQAYIALGNFMTCAALLGIDTCPMEGIEPGKYDEILKLPERGLATAVACPAGYRAADDKYAAMPKVRFKAEELIDYV